MSLGLLFLCYGYLAFSANCVQQVGEPFAEPESLVRQHLFVARHFNAYECRAETACPTYETIQSLVKFK